MLKIARWAVLAAMGLSLTMGEQGSASDISGKVEILDGDTLLVGGQRMKLAGIDAPELDQQCLNGSRLWRCGLEAALALDQLLTVRKASCQEESKGEATEEDLGRCFGQDQDIALTLLKRGYVITAADAPSDYRSAEASAQQAGLGLWRGEFVLPAAWRQGARLAAESQNPIICSAPSSLTDLKPPPAGEGDGEFLGKKKTPRLICDEIEQLTENLD